MYSVEQFCVHDKRSQRTNNAKVKTQTKFLKWRTKDSKHIYNRQRNFCVSLLRKTEGVYFKQLNNNRK